MRHAFKNQRLRSRLEDKVQDQLRQFFGDERADEWYESVKLIYTIPEREASYTPDFPIGENVYLETKGIWDAADRNKILLVLDQHPDAVIIMVFYNSEYKLYKGSPTTYGDWCDQFLIPWWDIRWGPIPDNLLAAYVDPPRTQENI